MKLSIKIAQKRCDALSTKKRKKIFESNVGIRSNRDLIYVCRHVFIAS